VSLWLSETRQINVLLNLNDRKDMAHLSPLGLNAVTTPFDTYTNLGTSAIAIHTCTNSTLHT